MMKPVYILAAISMAAAPVTAAVAQTDIISQLFTKATEVYSDKGYTPTGFQKRGELREGGEVGYIVTLKGGESYSLVGMCDTNCSNLDAYLTDTNGKLVDSDEQDDDFPIVAAPASGTYQLKLVMKSCNGTCAIGAMAFKK